MTTRVLAECWIPGRPRTKGSLDDHGNGGMSDSVASKRWRAHMVASVRTTLGLLPYVDQPAPASLRPIRIEALCFMPSVTADAIDELEDDVYAPTRRNTSNGDLDKLARNLLDALAVDLKSDDERKGVGLFKDDVQVMDLPIRKVLEGPLGPGILVRVTELDATEVERIQAMALAVLTIVTSGGQWGTGYLS